MRPPRRTGQFSARLRKARTYYEAFKDPMLAWLALAECESARAVPDWLFRYLVVAARSLMKAGEAPTRRYGAAIAGALGFTIGHGRNPFAEVFGPAGYSILAAFDQKKRELSLSGSTKRSAVLREVAAARGLKVSTVDAAERRYRKLIPTAPDVMLGQILSAVEKTPGLTRPRILTMVSGKTQEKGRAFSRLLESGHFKREGSGRKGDPYRYFFGNQKPGFDGTD